MTDMAQRRSRQSRNAASTAVQDNNEIDLIELTYRLMSNWALILSLALVGAILAGVYTAYFVTPLYQATSVIYIVSRESAINLSDLQLGSALAQDYIKVFDMWEVHAEVISKLGLGYTNAQMRSMVKVTNTTNTHMLDIAVTSPSAAEAATIANEYASVASQFIAETMSVEKPNIMSVALVPSNPVSPNRTRNVVIGFLLGAMLAVAIVTIRAIMDDKYKTADMIRRYTGLVNLAVIPFDEAKDA